MTFEAFNSGSEKGFFSSKISLFGSKVARAFSRACSMELIFVKSRSCVSDVNNREPKHGRQRRLLECYLTIRPVARKGYGSKAPRFSLLEDYY